MDSLNRAEHTRLSAEGPFRKRVGWKWLTFITGVASLGWFVARVIPKPSRAAYPCQRAAAPLASGFVIWVAGLVGARWAHRQARSLAPQCLWAGAVAALTLAVLAVWLPMGLTTGATAQQVFTPSEPPNQPMGVGQGIHPGRVVWVHQPDATSWDGQTGEWWDDANTNQMIVDDMLSRSLRSLTGRKTDREAWDALFRHLNQSRKLGNAGYRPGEKVTIKINANQDRGGAWRTGAGMHSPHLVLALLDQLIKAAGVPGNDIIIYDATRAIGDPLYRKARAGAAPDYQAVTFVVRPESAGNGRVAASWDKSSPIHFSQPGLPVAYLPECVTRAKYLINFGLLRPHTLFGVTLAAKNHFGSTFFPDNGGWTPAPLHNTGSRNNPMGSYNCLVDLNGHQQVAGKTMLFLLDGLYSSEHQQGRAMRFHSFGDDWVSSLFVSQDPVAIDSVGLDFLRNEPRATQVRGNPDNYLHEAALAGKPPSGTVYDPEKDGRPLTSLGVHEHWNNPAHKQYSRNFGKREGIELVALARTAKSSP